MAIRNVAIAGATGTVGKSVINAVVEHGHFNVTALIRLGGTTRQEFPSTVKILTVDYTDSTSLITALQGQEAVVSALSHTALDEQKVLIDASISAGVQRLIPSDFGGDTLNPKTRALPVFATKVAAQEHVRSLAAQGKISYTLVMTGPFLDFVLDRGFLGLDLKQKQLRYVDGGEKTFSTTTVSTIGKAVIGVLLKPEETKNRAVYIQEATLTLMHLLNLSKQALGGADSDWTEIDAGTTEQTERESYEKLANGETDMSVFIGFLLSAIFRDGYGGHFQSLDNELLGIKEMNDSEIVEFIKDVVKRG